MRVLIHGPGPWCPSGYGVQVMLLARGLRDAGHDVAISAFGGYVQPVPWEGIPVYACPGSLHGEGGHIPGNYERHKAEVLITVCDVWILDPREWKGMTVAPWIPVDTAPLGELDWRWLTSAAKVCDLHPVAMSGHGQAMMAERGIGSVVIPHMVQPVYVPGDRAEWRKAQGIDERAFLISLVGVNEGVPARKAFDVAMLAFAQFTEKHRNAKLCIHTEAQSRKGVDLARMAISLGLQGKVIFPDQYLRKADLLGPEYMAGMYSASDVLSAASRGGGFEVPIVESLACGTPVIASRCSAMTELIRPGWGWLADGQREWTQLHASWWMTPYVDGLARLYERAKQSGGMMRGAAAKAGDCYRPGRIMPLWESFLGGL